MVKSIKKYISVEFIAPIFLIIFGIIISYLFARGYFSSSFSSLYSTILIGYPIILLGVVMLFSKRGTIFVLSGQLLILFCIIFYNKLPFRLWEYFIIFSYLLIIAGIGYSLFQLLKNYLSKYWT